MRAIIIAMLLMTSAACGCSGERDKNKFKDLDRPKPAERR